MVMLVSIDEPYKVVYGGLTAAPVFSRIAAQAMQYLKVQPSEAITAEDTLPSLDQIFVEAAAPERQLDQSTVNSEFSGGPQMPNFEGLSYRQVLKVMKEKQLNVSFRGRGRVFEQSPGPGVAIPYVAWVVNLKKSPS